MSFRLFLVFVFVFVFGLTINFVLTSTLTIYHDSEYNNNNDNNNITTYSISTPPFALGDLNFPVSGLAVFGKGCSSINQIKEENLNRPPPPPNLPNPSNPSNQHRYNYSGNITKYILFVENTEELSQCFALNHIFDCQSKDWCSGVVYQNYYYSPCGFKMWSLFDKRRPRSDYKRPLVEAESDDFFLFKNIILEANKKNQSYQITLTPGPNKWEEMFTGIGFLLYFRILSPLWSSGCIIFITIIFWNQNKKKRSIKSRLMTHPHPHLRTTTTTSSTTINTTKRTIFFCFRFKKIIFLKWSLKRICLFFHLITHLARIILCVDPFNSQQIYSYITLQLLICSSIVFEIATNILLSFVIRELTQAKAKIDVLKNMRWCYIIISIFVILDYICSTLQALYPQLIFFLFLILWYVTVNIFLGIWYFWQGHNFIKKCKRLNNQNPERIILTQISMFNSIGMILFGIAVMFFGIKDIFGSINGYFAVYAVVTATIQITSFSEILLFGGIALNFKKVRKSLTKYSRRARVTSC